MVMVLTFQEEALPEEMFLGFLSFKVHPHRKPPMMCFNCQKYGHNAVALQGIRKCRKCKGEHEISDFKERVVKCGSCGGGHIAGSH